jgi:hypothetical protein
MKRSFTCIHDGTSEYELGKQYYDEGNYENAINMFMISANCGHPKSTHAVGLLYYLGQGVPRSVSSAVRWWKRSERLGYSSSDLFL